LLSIKNSIVPGSCVMEHPVGKRVLFRRTCRKYYCDY